MDRDSCDEVGYWDIEADDTGKLQAITRRKTGDGQCNMVLGRQGNARVVDEYKVIRSSYTNGGCKNA